MCRVTFAGQNGMEMRWSPESGILSIVIDIKARVLFLFFFCLKSYKYFAIFM